MHQTFGNETALHIFKSLARSLHDVFDMPVFVKLNSSRQKARDVVNGRGMVAIGKQLHCLHPVQQQ